MNLVGAPNLKKLGNFVRRLSRLLYEETIVYLLFDFLVEYGLVETETFAQIHKIDSQVKEIKAALNKLTSHGLLTMIDMKLEKFKSDYAERVGLKAEEVKCEGNIKV